jgi:hypothetical protein
MAWKRRFLNTQLDLLWLEPLRAEDFGHGIRQAMRSIQDHIDKEFRSHQSAEEAVGSVPGGYIETGSIDKGTDDGKPIPGGGANGGPVADNLKSISELGRASLSFEIFSWLSASAL